MALPLSPCLSIMTYLDQVSQTLKSLSTFEIQHTLELLRQKRAMSARIWIVGNGGSAATASHFAQDLQKMGKLDANALVNDIPVILAYGNDCGWDQMFALPLAETFRKDDLLIAISCSGKSVNVINAGKVALQHQGHLVVMTGKTAENPLSMLGAHAVIAVKSEDIRVVEDCHMVICHAIAGELSR